MLGLVQSTLTAGTPLSYPWLSLVILGSVQMKTQIFGPELTHDNQGKPAETSHKGTLEWVVFMQCNGETTFLKAC